jgi:flagellar hook assembly protein FlgD
VSDVAAPAVFALAQNAPNPFTARTTIRFSVPREGPVSLKIYDVRGRLVRTLVEGPLPGGAHVVHWDGRDVAGRTLASGVYFYRLTDGERIESRKTVRLR